MNDLLDLKDLTIHADKLAPFVDPFLWARYPCIDDGSPFGGSTETEKDQEGLS